LRDWPISRQLWWGHQIPVWTVVLTTAHHQSLNEPDDAYIERYLGLFNKFLEICGIREDVDYYQSPELIQDYFPYYVCARTPKAQKALDLLSQIAQHHSTHNIKLVRKYKADNDKFKELFGVEAFGSANELAQKVISCERDVDVLDTWFSSALWPFSTMGWPDDTPELETFYPGDVLCTAREIITLWVSRMVMMGQYCAGDIPFTDVYIHAMIQDGEGRKMSKSLGNGIDPLVAINSHGADAMRFTLANMTTDTQDIRMPVVQMTLPDGRVENTSPKFDIGRNFCNKLWNASRFALMNLKGIDPEKFDKAKMDTTDRWILSRLVQTIADVTKSLEEFKYNEPMSVLYRFFWNDFCDWYLEWIKPRMQNEEQKPIAQNVLAFVLDQTLRLLHPFVPFITEGIFQKLNEIAPVRKLKDIAEAAQADALVVAQWPERLDSLIDTEAEDQISIIQSSVRVIRDIKSQYNIPPATVLTTSANTSAQVAKILNDNSELICQLASVKVFMADTNVEKPKNAATAIVDDMQIFVHDVIDPKAERKRLQKQKQNVEKAKKAVEVKLANKNFIAKAKPEVVAQAKDRLVELTEQLKTIEKHLAELK
jgi:valyl-tRNA synthetase